jgi:hypothetical protein
MERSTNTPRITSAKDTPGQVLTGAMKAWKRMKKDLEVALGVTQPTALKLINSPELMDGLQRLKLSGFLNLPIDVIDDLVNGKYTSAQEFIDRHSVPRIQN